MSANDGGRVSYPTSAEVAASATFTTDHRNRVGQPDGIP
jgi:hypothetical protein